MSRWMLIRLTTGLKNNIHTPGFPMQSNSVLENTVKMYTGEAHTQPPFITKESLLRLKSWIFQIVTHLWWMNDSCQMNQSHAQPHISDGKMLKAQAKCVYFFEDPIPGKGKEQPAWLGGWRRQRRQNSRCIKCLVTTCQAKNVIWQRGGTRRRKENFWRFGSISMG